MRQSPAANPQLGVARNVRDHPPDVMVHKVVARSNPVQGRESPEARFVT